MYVRSSSVTPLQYLDEGSEVVNSCVSEKISICLIGTLGFARFMYAGQLEKDHITVARSFNVIKYFS